MSKKKLIRPVKQGESFPTPADTKHERIMADSEALEWDASNEEPADMGELDYDYRSVEEKIQAGLREKQKGNQLFAKGEYEAAWKQYDRCFVHIYTSKEEWAAIGTEGREAINGFKAPCHLNRGLCRLRKHDLTNALWDFTEALRILPNNPKGLYRRGLVYIGMIRKDLEKEGTDELWDIDVAEKRANDAKADLMKAAKNAPNDAGIRKALEELRDVREKLAEHRKRYREDQKKLYSTFISNLDRDNQKMREAEEKDVFKNMPNLERIRIG